MKKRNIDKLIKSIKENPFDYSNPYMCVGGHIRNLRNDTETGIDTLALNYLGCTQEQFNNIYWAGGSFSTNSVTFATREDAIRLLEELKK